MNATDLSTADVLRRAKQVLIERGWARDAYITPQGCVCAKGAIGLAVADDARLDLDGESADLAVFDRVQQVLFRAIGRPLAQWNDCEAESVDDVLAAFDRAIALAESEAS